MLSTNSLQAQRNHETPVGDSRRLSPTTRAVHDAILSVGHNTPTHAEIAQAAGVSVSTVQRSIKRLRDDGMLKWEQQFVKNKQVSNSYHVPTTIGDLMLGQNDRAITNRDIDTGQTGHNGTDTGPTDDSTMSCQGGMSRGQPPESGSGRSPEESQVALENLGRSVWSTAGDLPAVSVANDSPPPTSRAPELVDLFAKGLGRRCLPTDADRANWLRTARILLGPDARSFDEVAELIAWACADDHWRDRIPNLYDLRMNYEAVLAESRAREPVNAFVNGRHPERRKGPSRVLDF